MQMSAHYADICEQFIPHRADKNYYGYMDNKKNHSKTMVQLITINQDKAESRTNSPKISLVVLAERAYLELKGKYGINYVIRTGELQATMGVPQSTFIDNFAGINGFLSHVEQTLINEVAVVTDGASSNLDSKLYYLYWAIALPSKHTKSFPRKKTELCLHDIAWFAAEAFPPEYWEHVIAPMIPAIMEFLSEKAIILEKAHETIREKAMYLFAASFRFVVQLLTKEDFSNYTLNDKYAFLKDYIALYKKFVLQTAGTLILDRYNRETEMARIVKRLSLQEGESAFNGA